MRAVRCVWGQGTWASCSDVQKMNSLTLLTVSFDPKEIHNSAVVMLCEVYKRQITEVVPNKYSFK